MNIGFGGAKLAPEQIIVIGARDIDREEWIRGKQSGIRVYTMRDVDERGIPQLANDIRQQFAVGVGTPVSGDLSYRETRLLMKLISDTGQVRSMDVVECNPILDDHNRTGILAVDLIMSMLGDKFL